MPELEPQFLEVVDTSALEMRAAFSALREGAMAAGDLKVTASAVGRSVDVAAGVAFIQGDSVADQGLYRARSSSVVNSSGFETGGIAANPSGNPRLDQIVARVYDQTHDGSGLRKWRLEVLPGAPTAGATLDNRNGAVAILPPSAMRLADVLVPAGAAAIIAGNIRDRRTTAAPAAYRSARAIGVAFPTAAQSIADITFESNGRPYSIDARGAFQRQAGSGSLYAGIHVNGVPVGDGYTEVGYLGAMSAAQFGFWAKEAHIPAPVGRQVIQLIVQFTAAASDITSRSDQSLRVVEHI